MKKLNLITLLFFVSIGLLSAQQEQKPATIIQIKKSELFSFEDLKPFIAIAYSDKDYSSYLINNFKLTGSTTESGSNGINDISFIEISDGATLTEKQRSLLEKYGKKGIVFTLEAITMTKYGEPGKLYNANDDITITIPNILFAIKE